MSKTRPAIDSIPRYSILRFTKRSTLFLLLLAALLSSSCSRYYVDVRRQKINATYLASTGAHTPDPRQKKPPLGEMLILDWQLPMDIMEKKPTLRLYTIYQDNEEKVYAWPLSRRRGYRTFSVLNEEFIRTGGLLTYRVEIVTEDGQVYREWKHQLWVNLIHLD